MGPGKVMRAALAAAVAGLALTAAPASAAITSTSITAPADPSFFIHDYDSPGTIAIAGTTNSDAPATDQVDLYCYEGPVPFRLQVALGVPLNPGDGSFSVPAQSLLNVATNVCRLRAVPAGTDPSNLTPFTGPVLATGERDSIAIVSGPNTGTVYDYFVWGQQLTAAADYSSHGGCGFCDGRLFDSTFEETTTTFFGNDRFGIGSSRSQLQVDGADAYSPDPAEDINPDATGLPSLTYSYSLNPSNGNLTITESNPIVKCPNAAFPPDATSCPSFTSTGVTANRTITQEQDGHLVFITDTYVSSDGNQHTLDLQPINDQQFGFGFDDMVNPVVYKFPGESSFSAHTLNEVVSFPATVPATIFVNRQGLADGDETSGQGAIVLDRPASPATFTRADGERMFLQQSGVTKASCSPTFRFAYAQDYDSIDVETLAQTANTRFNATPGTVCTPDAPSPDTPAGAAASSAEDPKCKKLRKKLHRQKRNLEKALNGDKRDAVRHNIREIRSRLRKLGC